MAENSNLSLQQLTFDRIQDKYEILMNTSIYPQKQILSDKQNQLNRTTIPIKQYSNKFLRSQKNRPKADLPFRKINTQQRFHVVLKKKNIFNKYLPKENIFKFDDHFGEQKQALVKVSSIANPRKKYNIKTEASAFRENFQGSISHLQLLQSSFYTLLPTSNLLNPHKNDFFDDSRRQKKRNRSISIQNPEKKEKISQSRGLEIFSKIFIRNKDEILEKTSINKSQNHRQTAKSFKIEQNFQTRKITPMQKSRKRKILMQTYRPKKRSSKKFETINNYDELYELSGWETTI